MINESMFPNLAKSSFDLTSDATEIYNCIAFAAGVDSEWWDPLGVWPAGIGTEDTVENLMAVYRYHGFEESDDKPEAGFEKLASYATDNGKVYQHAAKLGADGRWLSKMGVDEDITHRTLDALESDAYGKVVKFMRRRTPESADDEEKAAAENVLDSLE
jgi:hypothetical protein